MIFKFISSIFLLLSSTYTLSATVDPLIGTWQIIDQRSGYYVSDIIIRKENSSQQYLGVIHKAYPLPTGQSTELCTVCQGTYKNQPIFGMQTLSDLKKSSQINHYHQGQWLNPQNGKFYTIEGTLNKKQDQIQMKAKAQVGNTTTLLLWKKL